MSDQKANIFYVEDDETLSFVTKDNLEINGYHVELFSDGESALRGFGNNHDICILDVMLPKMDGMTLAKEIRKKNSEIPIIFLTAKSLKEDKIAGLRLGADDYITKPFSIEELILKVEIFLKRKYIDGQVQEQISIGNYLLDHPNLTLTHKGGNQSLTQKEADLLKLLSDHRNQVIKRETILERIWGQNDYFLGRSMDVFISRLRKYLKEDDRISIENVHGVGFKFLVKT